MRCFLFFADQMLCPKFDRLFKIRSTYNSIVEQMKRNLPTCFHFFFILRRNMMFVFHSCGWLFSTFRIMQVNRL